MIGHFDRAAAAREWGPCAECLGQRPTQYCADCVCRLLELMEMLEQQTEGIKK